jgi:hypothetical protein
MSDLSYPLMVCFSVIDSAAFCSDTYCDTLYIVEDSTASLYNSEIQEFKLYPNPTSSNLTVELSRLKESSTLFIYNMVGEIVLNEIIADGEAVKQLDLSGLPKGLYVMTLRETYSNEQIWIEKFAKQ